VSISATDIRRILKVKNIKHLFHANTVLTTLSFFKIGGLLSRGAVEELGLPQTPQPSDEKDKELGIWYDVFFDSVDIHERAKELNKYGPLTLVFDPESLLVDRLDIKITKDNPVRWDADTPINDRYFEDLDLLRTGYKKGAFYQHLTICNMKHALPFRPSLQQIIIDNPKTTPNEHFENAFASLRTIIEQSYPDVELIVRECSDDCTCTSKYNEFKPGAIWYKYCTE
jgi:hypothetical protein